MFIPSTFNSMEDYGNLLLMRLLLRFLSFLFHYFINEVRKTRKKLLNLQSQECQLQDQSSGLRHHQEDSDQQISLEVELCCRWWIRN